MQKKQNNAYATLAVGIGTGDTSISLTTGQGARFPSLGTEDYHKATLIDGSNNLEIVRVTDRATDTLTVVRAQEGTSARAYAAGDRIEMRWTKETAESDQQEANVALAMSGTNTYTGTLAPVPKAYNTGQIYWLRFSNTNTVSNPTANLNSLGAKTMKRQDGSAILPSELPTGVAVPFHYDGTNLLMLALNQRDYLTTHSLVDLIHIDSDTGHRDLIADGWFPAFFNQQWGGAPHYFELTDGATGVPYKFEGATGHIEQDNSNAYLGHVAGLTWRSNGFKVSNNLSTPAIWVKVFKIGNPANNLELMILPDDGSGTKPTGSTPITNGTATAQSGKLHSSDTNGQWTRFVFSTPPALTAGTTYHIALKSSGAVDAANYWSWLYQAAGRYPHGNTSSGDGTPTWTAGASDHVFLVEASATTTSLQSGGIFSDGKLVFFEGTPLNQSNGRVKNLQDFRGLDLTDFTLLVRGSAFTKDKTILDITYGLDHDRIVLRSNVTTGYAQVDVYENDHTKHTITATSVDLSAGDHDVAIAVRAKGDGADYVKLWVDGAANGTQVSAATITFTTLFGLAQIGTFWLGGGFAVAPTWTQKLAMGVLPSADSPAWTWTGTGTESACMSVSGGNLYQNKNGYASTDTGYYARSALSLSNASGWAVSARAMVSSSPNASQTQNLEVEVHDGAKRFLWSMQEYFGKWFNGAAWQDGGAPQVDLKSSQNEHFLIGKGSDAMIFINGRLVVDGSTVLTGASGSNQIFFGDASSAVDDNANAVWDYLAYYNTAWLPPQFTAGSISELAAWSGDKTSLLPLLHNSGARVSVKQFCGVEKNYVGGVVVQKRQQQGITSTPTSTTLWISLTPEAEMECFVIGSVLDVEYHSIMSSSVANDFVLIAPVVDGNTFTAQYYAAATNPSANEFNLLAKRAIFSSYFGLHKVEGRQARESAGTTTGSGKARTLQVEVR